MLSFLPDNLLRSRINRAFLNAAEKVRSSTPQLYRYRQQESSQIKITPKPWASAVLIKVANYKFLVTAAHALDDEEKQFNPATVGLLIKNTLIPLWGNIKFFDLKYAPNDKIDLAVLLLKDEERINKIESEYRFLDIEEIEFNHTSKLDNQYLMIGYPITKTKISAGQIHPTAFVYLADGAKGSVYKSIGLNKELHIAIEFRKRRINNFKIGNMEMGPNPYGLSGCGLWNPESSDLLDSLKLVGITIEWDALHSAIIGTKVDCLVPVLTAFMIHDEDALKYFYSFIKKTPQQ